MSWKKQATSFHHIASNAELKCKNDAFSATLVPHRRTYLDLSSLKMGPDQRGIRIVMLRFSMTKRCNKKENRNSNPEKFYNESIFHINIGLKMLKKSHLLHSIACFTWLQDVFLLDVNLCIECLEAYCLSERDLWVGGNWTKTHQNL